MADMRTHPLKNMASGPLKIEKGTRPVLILATHRHTTESVVSDITKAHAFLNVHRWHSLHVFPSGAPQHIRY